MQISIGKQGTKLKLTKRERDTLDGAYELLAAIERHGGPDNADHAKAANDHLHEVIKAVNADEST